MSCLQDGYSAQPSLAPPGPSCSSNILEGSWSTLETQQPASPSNTQRGSELPSSFEVLIAHRSSFGDTVPIGEAASAKPILQVSSASMYEFDLPEEQVVIDQATPASKLDSITRSGFEELCRQIYGNSDSHASTAHVPNQGFITASAHDIAAPTVIASSSASRDPSVTAFSPPFHAPNVTQAITQTS